VAIPPTIPTSFVPKQPVTTSRKRTSGANPFLALAYIIVTVALVGAAGVFGYQYYLEGLAKKKANDVVTAQRQIDQATVTQFIRLRDRFTAAQGILTSHVALSQYFDTLETLTLPGVTFTKLKVTVAEDRSATIDMSGTARTFNTLAAQSAAFATDKRIKRAIFSAITVKDNAVSFDLAAELDPTLVTFAPGSHPAAVVLPPVQATTSATTTKP
jgi:hypothetical protein